MYRHFAAVTLVATMALAMFASGENREAIAREVEQAGQQSARTNPNDFVRKDSKRRGSFGTDAWVNDGFGQPSDGASIATNSGIVPGEAKAPDAGMPAGHTVYGVSAEIWATLTEAQKSALIASRNAARKAAATPERVREIDALLAASRARSGAAAALTD